MAKTSVSTMAQRGRVDLSTRRFGKALAIGALAA
jgi:hypothetical protein